MNARLPEGFRPPIVEMVLELDCEGLTDLAGVVSTATDAFKGTPWPKRARQMVQEHRISGDLSGTPQIDVSSGIQALQFRTDDDKELVQIRAGGYAFNRLAPYSSLDDYIAAIQASFELYRKITRHTRINRVKLRYINRLLLPLDGRGTLNIAEYLRQGPQLPGDGDLTFVGFLNQHKAIEKATMNRVDITTATQKAEGGQLPIVLDIQAMREGPLDTAQWPPIAAAIEQLRGLAKRVFFSTVTERCTNLFQH